MALVIFGNRPGTKGTDYVELEAERLVMTPFQQEKGVQKHPIDDLSGGFLAAPDVLKAEEAANRYSLNSGLQARLKGKLLLPYEVVNQTAVTSGENISASVAANIRAHGLNTSVGGTQRFLVALGQRIYRNNTSTGALEVASGNIDGAGSNISMGGVITVMAELQVGGAEVVVVATRGNSGAVYYTTNVSASPIVWTTLLPLAEGTDVYVYAMGYFPTLGSGINVIAGKIHGINGFWYEEGSVAQASWLLKPIVLADGRTESGNGALTTTGPIYPVWAVADNTPSQNSGTDPSDYKWDNATAASGVSDATAAEFDYDASAAVGDRSGDLFAGGFIFDIPRVALVEGILWEVEREVENVNSKIVVFDASLLVNGGRKGIGKPDKFVWPTTKAWTEYGALDDNWGATWTGRDLETLVTRYAAGQLEAIPATDGEARVYTERVTVQWRMPGTMISLSTGGYMVKRSPIHPLRLTVVTPSADETVTITRPRTVTHLDFAWDTEGDRVVMSTVVPATGMEHVHAAIPFQGGWHFSGANTVGQGSLAKGVDDRNDVLNFEFPGWDGVGAMVINAAFEQGSWAILEVVRTGMTDRQWWYYGQDAYHLDTLRQSLSSLGIAAQPMPWGVADFNRAQKLIYSIFPNGSSTAVARQYLPSNLGEDPRNIDSEITKTMAGGTTAAIVSPKLALAGAETLQTLLAVSYQGDRISSSDTVQFKLATNATPIATPNLNQTFTAPGAEYKIPGGGLLLDYFQYEIRLAHSPATSTPNGLPLRLHMFIEERPEREIVVWCSDFTRSGNVIELIHDIEAMQRAEPVRGLWLLPYPADARAIPVVFDRWIWPEGGVGMPPSNDQRAQFPAILSRDVKGQPAPLPVGFVFRSVPGVM